MVEFKVDRLGIGITALSGEGEFKLQFLKKSYNLKSRSKIEKKIATIWFFFERNCLNSLFFCFLLIF